MKTTITLCLLAAGSVWSAEEATRTIEKSFSLTGNNRTVAVCGINSNIQVTASDSNEVRFSVQEKLAASTRDRLDDLKREIDVVFAQEGSLVRAGVKGPWSDGDCGQSHRNRNNNDRRRWDDRDTRIEHNFTVSVPRDARLELRSVNGGLTVTGTTGSYSLNTVNGSINMTDVEGAGEVRTVNGGVQAVYRKNPQAETQFRTVNGKLNLYFQPALSADFAMKTVNGKAYTDFEMFAVPGASSGSNQSDGMKVIYRRGNSGTLRAGSGGTKISTETVNGEILIHSLAKGRP